MHAEFFLDTNILLYAASSTEDIATMLRRHWPVDEQTSLRIRCLAISGAIVPLCKSLGQTWQRRLGFGVAGASRVHLWLWAFTAKGAPCRIDAGAAAMAALVGVGYLRNMARGGRVPTQGMVEFDHRHRLEEFEPPRRQERQGNSTWVH
jgi:hypothetical protein